MNQTDRLDELLSRWQDLCEQGRQPTPGEVCADTPELADEFEQRLQWMQHLEGWLGVESAGADETPWSQETVLSPDQSVELAPQVGLPFLDKNDTADCLGRLGPYRVLEVLGEGGMGVVLKAEEQQPRRLVAIKVMRPEKTTPETRQRFLREGQALALVQHDRVVPVHRVDEFRGVPFLVMPLLAGESLQARLKREPRLPLSDVVRIGREAAEGLAAAHAAGLIHRDIKPSNIWLRGPEQQVVLLDFGLARIGESVDGDGSDLTRAGSVLGTAAFMAPEQAAARPVDARADLFSLGCVLYELTTGERPFTGPDLMAILSALANHDPPPPTEVQPHVPVALSSLIMRLLAKLPEDRPQSAEEVIEALRAIESDDSAYGPTISMPPSATSSPDTRRRGLWMFAILAALFVGVAFWAGNAILNSDSPADPGLSGTGQSPASPAVETPAVEPLRVASIDLQHFARLNATDASPRGILGQDSFDPRLGDQVTIEARLSRPGYAYVVAFRPDGVVEPCYPFEPTEPPPLSEVASYPPADRVGHIRYGLTDGTGLWVFAVVASEEPLPAWQDWIESQSPAWMPQSSRSETVWWYDGAWITPRIPSGLPTRFRGGGEEAVGPSGAVVDAADWLGTATNDGSAAAIGFGVGASGQVEH